MDSTDMDWDASRVNSNDEDTGSVASTPQNTEHDGMHDPLMHFEGFAPEDIDEAFKSMVANEDTNMEANPDDNMQLDDNVPQTEPAKELLARPDIARRSHIVDDDEPDAFRPSKAINDIKIEVDGQKFHNGETVDLTEDQDDVEITHVNNNRGHVIDLESEEPVVKKEPKPDGPGWGLKQKGTIILGDDDDDVDAIELDDGTLVPLKKEPKLVPLDRWEGMKDARFDVTTPAGLAKLRGKIDRTPRVPPEKMREVQQAYARKAMQGRAGAGNIFRPPGTAATPAPPVEFLGSKRRPAPTLHNDGFEWMHHEVVVDDDDVDPSEAYRKLKEIYNAKKKVRRNTMADDIEMERASRRETERVKCLLREAEDSDEAEESDDGLSAAQIHALAAGYDEDDHTDHALIEALGELPTHQPKQKELKGYSLDAEARKKRNAEWRKEHLREKRFNMMAGIEAILLRDQVKHEKKAAKAIAEKAGEKNKRKRGGRPKKNKKAPDLSAKRTKTGRVSNIGSLATSNVYEDSNANLDKTVLPVVSEKNKKEFLTKLIACIPLEDFKQAKSDKIDILSAIKMLGSRRTVPDNKGNWSFKGMKSALYHHQVQGAASMKMRELAENDIRGGILADEMGLGKTIQAIAAMVANRQSDPDLPKCTLIVCPNSLLSQWESEFQHHVDENVFKRITRHHGGSGFKYSGKGAETEMEHSDVIITTYGEVVRSYPYCVIPQDIEESSQKLEYWIKYWDANRDWLHRAHFYRVILDESQAIKNHSSRTSIACRALMARHRWALSGTPIQNHLEELFPYFKFLRVPHTGSLGIFKYNYCLKDSEQCNKRLISKVQGIMIRRTHADTLLGAPLVVLPRNTHNTITLQFNNVEREIYEAIRERCVRAINNMARNEDLEKKFPVVIYMFQRLRQMVSHIFQVQESIEREFELEQIKYLRSDNTTTDAENDMIKGLERIIADRDLVATNDDVTSNHSGSQQAEHPNASTSPPYQPQAGVQTTVNDDSQGGEDDQDEADVQPAPGEGSSKPKKKKAPSIVPNFVKKLRELRQKSKWTELRDNVLCQLCGGPAENPHVTSCFHLYCKECLLSLQLEAADKDLDRAQCAKCGHLWERSEFCGGLKELEVRDLSSTVFQEDESNKSKARPKQVTMKYVDSDNKLVLSSKVAAVKRQLAEWIGQDPHAKIIVFSEWHMVMHLIGRVCQQERWGSCHYNGRISHKQRDQALAEFARDPSIKVMVASLKCGGTGLNLTAASKVICVDLWYNKCIEEQAFCRVHRIGQTRETFITRFTVKDTVDDRLIKMQEEKKIIISDTIDNRSLLKHLTVEELMSLFGTVAYDEDRKPFILVDDELDLRLKKKKKGGSNKGSKGGGKGKGKATTAQEGQDGGDADTQDGGTEDGDTQDGGTEQQEEEES